MLAQIRYEGHQTVFNAFLVRLRFFFGAGTDGVWCCGGGCWR